MVPAPQCLEHGQADLLAGDLGAFQAQALFDLGGDLLQQCASERGRFLPAAFIPAMIFDRSNGSRCPERLTTTNGTSSSRS